MPSCNGFQRQVFHFLWVHEMSLSLCRERVWLIISRQQLYSSLTDEVEVEVKLRPTVSWPVCPGVRRPYGTCDQFIFLLQISFRPLRLCYFVAPSLTRGLVCNLLVQLLLGLVRAVTLGSKSRRTQAIFYFLFSMIIIWLDLNVKSAIF
jgi:hypothetical protein